MDKQLIELVKKAGIIALEEQKNMSVSKKPDTSIVTNGDLKVSAFLEQELVKLYPDFEVFSEENSKQVPKSNKVIVIDPIDGTQSYSRRQNTWSILIGFMENGVPTKGIVYQVPTGKLYYGAKGEGSYLLENGTTKKLSAIRTGPLKSFASPSRAGEGEFLQSLQITETEYMYSASLKIMEIALGNSDIYPNFQKKCSLWDLVAPDIILSEAGGKMVYESDPGVNFNNPHINTKFCAIGPRLFNKKLF